MVIDLLSDKTGYLYSRSISDRANDILAQLKTAEYRFNQATDSYETEACIYRLKTLEAEYCALIREAKLNMLCGKPNVRSKVK